MKTILIVDENRFHRGFVRHVLESAGYQVIEAANVQTAVKTFQSQPLDLIITDLFISTKAGIELIRFVRRQNDSAKIIALCDEGKSPEIDQHALALAEGASASVKKPVSQIDLITAVGDLLGHE